MFHAYISPSTCMSESVLYTTNVPEKLFYPSSGLHSLKSTVCLFQHFYVSIHAETTPNLKTRIESESLVRFYTRDLFVFLHNGYIPLSFKSNTQK